MVESETCKIRVIGNLEDQTTDHLSESFAVSFLQQNIIYFSGYQWRVRENFLQGPGGNLWTNSENSVFVDEEGNLNLSIRKLDGLWRCSEVILNEPIGHGECNIKLGSDFHSFNKHVLTGFFTYKGNNCETNYPARCEEEIDSEFSY